MFCNGFWLDMDGFMLTLFSSQLLGVKLYRGPLGSKSRWEPRGASTLGQQWRAAESCGKTCGHESFGLRVSSKTDVVICLRPRNVGAHLMNYCTSWLFKRLMLMNTIKNQFHQGYFTLLHQRIEWILPRQAQMRTMLPNGKAEVCPGVCGFNGREGWDFPVSHDCCIHFVTYF